MKVGMIEKFDEKYRFYSAFNPNTGFYIRSGIIENGNDSNRDPFMASFPELLDIGVMGHCVHGKSGLCVKAGVQCYQDGLHIQKQDMSLQNFQRIVEECKGKTYQFALGGRGDVDQHENFEELLRYSREANIVPNFTTSGLGMNERIARLCKKYCGAVAVSWYRSQYTITAVEMLLKHQIKTNIHYVLSNTSIDEAIERLKTKNFPEGINAIIFLLHKSVGLGEEQEVLHIDNPKISVFFELVDGKQYPFKIGFDSCTVPGILNYTKLISEESIDTCEGGRWSAYITSDMKMLPCSFDNQQMRWAHDTTHDTIQHAWDSECFNDFRNQFHMACPDCSKKEMCMGGCPICPSSVLCNRMAK